MHSVHIIDQSLTRWYEQLQNLRTLGIRACTSVFNVEVLEVYKKSICKEIVEASLRKKTSLARNLNNNQRLTPTVRICCLFYRFDVV
jgi:hypothetical protein